MSRIILIAVVAIVVVVGIVWGRLAAFLVLLSILALVFSGLQAMYRRME
jgi:hypothetical protein